MSSIKKFFPLFVLLFASTNFYAQTFQVNGDAVDHGNGLIRLTSSTPAGGAGVWQQSSAWNTVPIDLSKPFDKSFDMFFGCESGPNGGDGITFTFQTQGLTALGGGGGNLGLNGIKPAISIEFDTWDAGPAAGDIPEDHFAVDVWGDVINGQPFLNKDGNVVTAQPVAGGRDLEDCAENSKDYYSIRIKWDPSTMALQLFENGESTPSLTYYEDLINNIFGGTKMVYWGFTSATGSASNEQWIAPQGSVIPWQCTTNSCCPKIDLVNTGPTTICNNPITLGVQGTFESYTWSNGDQSETSEITAPGTYTLNVLQKQTNGAMCPASTTFTINPSGPTAKLSGSKTLCDNTLTTPLSVALTGSAPWGITYAIDGTPQPAITGITSSPYVFNGNATHTYTLSSVTDIAGCNGISSGSATVGLFPGAPVGHDASFMTPGTADLSVDNAGGNYTWFADPSGSGTPLFTGANYTTGVLNATTTFYVKNTLMTGFTTKSAGLLNSAAGTGDPNNISTDLPKDVLYQNFTANDDFKLDSITCAINVVLPWTSSMVSVTIKDKTDNTKSRTIDSLVTTPLASGNQNFYMALNFACIKGHDYEISYAGLNSTGGWGGGSIKGIIYWTLVSFPINTTPEISLTVPDINTRPAQSYPGLFNWRITVKSPSSSCGLTPVTAYICPTGTITGSTSICDDGVSTAPLSVALTGSPAWSLVYAIDGVDQTPVTGISASPYTFNSLPGAHTYTLKSVKDKNSGNCGTFPISSATISINTNKAVVNDVSFTAPATPTLTAANPSGTYNWYDAPVGGNLLQAGGASYTPTSPLTATTTYYVEEVVNGVVSCERTTATAFLCPTGTISGDASICDDGVSIAPISIALTGTPNWTLVYAIDGVNQTPVSGIQTSPYTFNSLPGAHTYTLISVNNTNTNNCQATGTVTINVKPSGPAVNDISFTAPATPTLTAANPSGTYNWYDAPVGGNLLQAGGASYTPTSPLTATTTYYVEEVVNGVVSCERSPATAFLCPTGTISGDASICDDGVSTSKLTIALTGTPNWTIVYKIDGIPQSPVTVTDPTYTFNSLPGAHTYTLVSVNNANTINCQATGTATITISPDRAITKDTTFNSPGTATLTVINTGGTYFWYDAPIGGKLLQTGGLSYTTGILNDTTTYYVERVVNNEISCERSPATAFPIYPPIVEPKDLEFIPNLITPNGDGKNDVFHIVGLPEKTNLTIYNRWGAEVFHTDDYANNWTGGDNGAGVYYYKLNLVIGKEYHGWVQLVR